MSGFILVKGMNRELTDDVRKRIAEWWEANPEKSMDEVISHWEQELGVPITKHAVARTVMGNLKPTEVHGPPTSEPE